MLYYLGLTEAYPWVETLSSLLYHGILIFSVLIALYLVGWRLSRSGYARKDILIVCAFTLLIALPAGFTASRATQMLYRPPALWDWESLIHFALSGTTQTYHTGIIVPAILLPVFFRLMRYDTAQLMDTIALYVPIAHAIGRVACLLVGCCWGRDITLSLFGVNFLEAPNPVPIYAILSNLAIFFLLRRIYLAVYSPNQNARGYRGSVFGAYFLLYGSVRMTMEIFRVEPRILMGLTQAQLAMLVFIVIGGSILLLLVSKRHKPTSLRSEQEREILRFLGLVGLIGSYLLVFFLLYNLMHSQVLRWPFSPVNGLSEAYSSILYYSPVLLYPALSLVWLTVGGHPVWKDLSWQRSSRLFYLALAISLGYSFYLLNLGYPQLRGPLFWPPVILLSAINSLSEELLFRQGFFRFLRAARYTPLATVFIQSVFYSLGHFSFSSSVVGILALIYGMLLGYIRHNTQSLTPCLIAHFSIDLGCIGLPMLYIL